jgi:hypothetical protein
MTLKIWHLLNQIDHGEFSRLIKGTDYLKTWHFIERNIFSLKD